MCAGVALMLGGDWLVVVIAAAAAVMHRPAPAGDGAAAGCRPSTSRSPGGAVATLLAVGPRPPRLDVDPSLVVTANIVMLLAGIGFMGALQDALSGFYVTGGARLTEALLATAGIIAGVSGGLTRRRRRRGRASAGSSPARRPGQPRLGDGVVGAAICAGAFAFASYAPPRVLLPIAVIAGARDADLAVDRESRASAAPGRRPSPPSSSAW